MNAYKLVIAILLLLPLVSAQYWFQSGARGGQASQFNSGASVNIETLSGQQSVSGSIAYWVGEDLQNGAFLQTGYVIENQSGRYPSFCDTSGCSQYEYISAGAPEWFYEYFPPGNNNAFYGGIGPNDSAGKSGSYNTYAFYSNGTTWHFEVDGKQVGQVNLGSNTSGYNDVVAFGELANTTSGNTSLSVVKFYNLSIYRFGKFVPSPTGYSYIGYGVGSLSNIVNPYGVQEIGSLADAFEVGTGLQTPHNDYPLWSSSYMLNILSKYGNLSASSEYIASKTVGISAPTSIYISPSTRALFTGWSGNGPGSYTGQSNASAVLMYSNISEIADWQLQYLVNVSTSQGMAHGTGWYPANSTAYYSTGQNTIYAGASSRYLFAGWTTGNRSLDGTIKVTGPLNISAQWARQYELDAASQFGNVTGTGWYAANSTANITLTRQYINQSASQRTAFYSWSDGNTSASRSLLMDRPYNLNASFHTQFLVGLYGTNAYGSRVKASQFYIDGAPEANQTYLFAGDGYTVTGAVYDGSIINVSQSISTNSSTNIAVSLPLYNVDIYATDVFGVPVSMPVNVTFSNKTTEKIQLSQSGAIIPDVPYGRAVASTNYLGLGLSSSVQNGSQARFTVVSIQDIAIFAAIVVLAFAMYFIASRHVLKSHNQ